MKGCIAIALLACSCSLGVSGPPDKPDPNRKPSCTTSRTSPTLDLIGATSFGVAGLAYLIGRCGPGDHGQETDQTCEGITNAIGVVLLVPAALFAISSASGFSKTGRCREAIRAFDARHPQAH